MLQYYLTELEDAVCFKKAFKQARLNLVIGNLPELRQKFAWYLPNSSTYRKEQVFPSLLHEPSRFYPVCDVYCRNSDEIR